MRDRVHRLETEQGEHRGPPHAHRRVLERPKETGHRAEITDSAEGLCRSPALCRGPRAPECREKAGDGHGTQAGEKDHGFAAGRLVPPSQRRDEEVESPSIPMSHEGLGSSKDRSPVLRSADHPAALTSTGPKQSRGRTRASRLESGT